MQKQARIDPMMAAALGSLGSQVFSSSGQHGAFMGSMDPGTYIPGGGLGGGVRDIGLAQLSATNPEAARLAAARLEAETNVNAMDPFEGMSEGALIGAPLGGLAGAGLGYAALGGAGTGAGLTGAALGGLTGAALGGLTGGRISRRLEMERRRANAYKHALSQLGQSRAQRVGLPMV